MGIKATMCWDSQTTMEESDEGAVSSEFEQ
jgi:hypothetical protein